MESKAWQVNIHYQVVLEKIYENQIVLEAGTDLLAEQQGLYDFGDNAHTALNRIGENADFIKRGWNA